MLKSLLIVIITIACTFSTAYAKLFIINIDEIMQDNTQLHDNIDIILQAHKQDTIFININSPGGSVDVLLKYQRVLSLSGAHTIGHVENYNIAMSAAGMLLMSLDEIDLEPRAIFMAHQIKDLSVNKAYNDITVFMLNQCCSKILYKYDISRIVSGGEVYLSGLEVQERLKIYPVLRLLNSK